jgi:hypothetical protein
MHRRPLDDGLATHPRHQEEFRECHRVPGIVAEVANIEADPATVDPE